MQDYGVDLDYLESVADNAEAVKDYFNAASAIGPRNLGTTGFDPNARNLPEGVNFEDFVQTNGSFDITAFREAMSAALVASQDEAPVRV